jgi:signal transduction histidine kinase
MKDYLVARAYFSGWSIVRRIAQATGAQVQVMRSESLGGLQVQVRWPLAPSPC